MSAVERVVRAALNGRRVLQQSAYPGTSVGMVVRLHPATVREVMLEEGVDPDALLELAGNRLAGMPLIPDVTIDPAILVVESASWITLHPVSWAPDVHVEQSQTFRAAVNL